MTLSNGMVAKCLTAPLYFLSSLARLLCLSRGYGALEFYFFLYYTVEAGVWGVYNVAL